MFHQSDTLFQFCVLELVKLISYLSSINHFLGINLAILYLFHLIEQTLMSLFLFLNLLFGFLRSKPTLMAYQVSVYAAWPMRFLVLV